MRNTLIILLTFFSIKSYSQIEGVYEFNTKENKFYKKSSYVNHLGNINFDCNPSYAYSSLDKINRNSKEFIINRTGLGFFNDIKIFRVEIKYDNPSSSYNISVYKKPHKHTYWFSYSGKYNGVFYSFALMFDEDGKLIKNHNFPDLENKIFLTKIIDSKNAIKNARSLRKSLKRGKISIVLKYLEKENILCYLIEKNPEVQKNLKKNPNYYEYISKKVYINAYTNELVKEETKKEQIFGTAPIGILNAKTAKKD